MLAGLGKLIVGGLAGSAIVTPAVLLTAPPKFDLRTDSKFRGNCQLFTKDLSGQKQLIVCSFEETWNSPSFFLYTEGETPVPVWKLKNSSSDTQEIELELGNEENSSNPSVKIQIPTPKGNELLGVNLGGCDFANNTTRTSEKWKLSCDKADNSQPKKEIDLTPLFSK